MYYTPMLRLWDILALLFINAIFAGAYLVGNAGVAHFPPLFFAALRFVLVAILLLPFIRLNADALHRAGGIIAFSLAMGVGVYSTMYLALWLADGTATILIGTQFATPLAALLGHFLLGEKTRTAVWAGIFIALLGVFIVGFDAALLGYPLAFFLILISAGCYAFANVISRGLRGAVGVMNLNGWMALISAPPLLAMSFIFEQKQMESMATAGLAEWSTILYSALAVTLIGHVGMFLMLRRHPVSAVMPFYVLTPIIGVIGSVVFFDELLTIQFIFGAIAAIIGVAVVNRYSGGR